MSFVPKDNFQDHICTLCKHERRCHDRLNGCVWCSCKTMIFGNLEYLEWKLAEKEKLSIIEAKVDNYV